MSDNLTLNDIAREIAQVISEECSKILYDFDLQETSESVLGGMTNGSETKQRTN